MTEITEVKIGYDFASRSRTRRPVPPWDLTPRRDLGLAKDVPNEAGELVANPYKKWTDINKDLPDVAIEVLGPPPTSGTRDASRGVGDGRRLRQFDSVKALKDSDKDMHKQVCHGIREDGAFIEAGRTTT